MVIYDVTDPYSAGFNHKSQLCFPFASVTLSSVLYVHIHIIQSYKVNAQEWSLLRRGGGAVLARLASIGRDRASSRPSTSGGSRADADADDFSGGDDADDLLPPPGWKDLSLKQIKFVNDESGEDLNMDGMVVEAEDAEGGTIGSSDDSGGDVDGFDWDGAEAFQ